MIDTIKITINITDVPVGYDQFLLKLKLNTIKKNQDNEINITGYIKNFRITLDKRGIRVEGSLTKYLFGDNFRSATVIQLSDGIDKLCAETRLDLKKGIVSRIDIAENVLTKFPVNEYFDGLLSLRYFKNRYIINKTTLKFGSTHRHITFYDKIAELKRNKIEIDGIFKNNHFLRVELSYSNHKSICRLLKLKICSTDDVFLNYTKIIDEWYRLFNSIDKKTDSMIFDFENLKTSKDIFKQLQIQGVIKLNGLSEVLKMIDSGKKRGHFKSHPNVATNIRSSIKKLMKTPNLIQDSQLNKELLQKISLIHFHAYPKQHDEYVHL